MQEEDGAGYDFQEHLLGAEVGERYCSAEKAEVASPMNRGHLAKSVQDQEAQTSAASGRGAGGAVGLERRGKASSHSGRAMEALIRFEKAPAKGS